jgi:DNA-binding IclR family transcriptional regulator
MSVNNRSRGIQSVEIGYRILVALQAGQPAPLKTIAERTKMTPSAVHNYLASLMRIGMVEAVGRGQYQLGPSLAALGLTALRHTNSFEVVRAEAVVLSERTELGIAILTWTHGGTSIVYFKEGKRRGPFDLRNGPVSIIHTGGGNVFVGYLEAAMTLPAFIEEAAVEGLSARKAKELHTSIASSVREAGYAVTELSELPGYKSVSAPVWSSEDQVSYALTITGPTGAIDASAESEQIAELLATTRKVSRQLGAPPIRWDSK